MKGAIGVLIFFVGFTTGSGADRFHSFEMAVEKESPIPTKVFEILAKRKVKAAEYQAFENFFLLRREGPPAQINAAKRAALIALIDLYVAERMFPIEYYLIREILLKQ